MLAERGMPIQKTHDLTSLLDQLLTTDPTLRSFRRGLKGVSRYAVEYRYPGMNTSARQARTAYQKTVAMRAAIRKTLGLPAAPIR